MSIEFREKRAAIHSLSAHTDTPFPSETPPSQEHEDESAPCSSVATHDALNLRLYNRHTKEKEVFTPADPKNVTMYVCGPTIYHRIHIGNARTFTIFDMLYRILTARYESVTYVRNITDVDDKIVAASLKNGVSIDTLTATTRAWFLQDCQDLGLLSPTHQPQALHFIQPIVDLVQRLVQKNIAYVCQDHVLFSVDAWQPYGTLSHMTPQHMEAGARVEIAPYKKNPLDFVLWKPAKSTEVEAWPSPWGRGRPGWHSECAVMSQHYLGPVFDLHGGGADLCFPHHENERAQICALNETQECARYWVHSNMLQVNGEKMSKSLGNFVTLRQALDMHSADVVRWALLTSHYRHPLNWCSALLTQAEAAVKKLHHVLQLPSAPQEIHEETVQTHLSWDDDFFAALLDDMNTPLALHYLQQSMKNALHGSAKDQQRVHRYAAFCGFGTPVSHVYEPPCEIILQDCALTEREVEAILLQRHRARVQKDFTRADTLRSTLLENGIHAVDTAQGVSWHYVTRMEEEFLWTPPV